MRITGNTIRDIKNFYFKELSEIYPQDEVLALFRISCEEISGFSHLHLHFNAGDEVLQSELLTYENWINRLKNFEPIQYITGRTWFMDLEIQVNDSVLIPRPETEELVNLVLEKLIKKDLKVLDACSGSGCIALAMKHYLPEADIYACEISIEAIKVAQKNANRLSLGVNFIESDLLNMEENYLPTDLDIIISNPPYIPVSEKESMSLHVTKSEPEIALFVRDSNPLIFYEKLANLALINLKDGGFIYVECHKNLIENVQGLFLAKGLLNAKIHSDLSGNERFVTAQKSNSDN
jgi:release factor glutamine methyltransferase